MKKLSIALTFSAFLLFGSLSCREDSNQQKKGSGEETSSPINTSSERKASRVTTRLHIVSNSGNANEVRELISAGADVNAATKHGETPLHSVSTGQGNAEIAKLLIDAGADVNAKARHGDTPLYTAVNFGKAGIVKVFIEAEADACVRSHDGKGALPLHYAQSELRTAKRENDFDTQEIFEEIVQILEEATKKQRCLLKETHPALK